MGVLARAARVSSARLFLIHLRLHFQLLLAPVFLWGYVLAGGRPALPGLAIFFAFHVFGYGGGTAFNSYYDRDEGPIGGLAIPPPVVPALLPFSLLWQALGGGIVLGLNRPAALVYAAMFWLSVAYSHPAVRWKRRTWMALLTVATGQGLLAFAAGWLAARPEWDSLLAPPAWLGAGAAAFLVTGFYPLSQLFQVEEDRRRGDQTLAVRFGPPTVLAVAATLSIVGLSGLVSVASRRFGLADGLVLLLGYTGLGIWLLPRGRALWNGGLSTLDLYRLVMRVAALNAAGLWLYLMARLALNS